MSVLYKIIKNRQGQKWACIAIRPIGDKIVIGATGFDPKFVHTKGYKFNESLGKVKAEKRARQAYSDFKEHGSAQEPLGFVLDTKKSAMTLGEVFDKVRVLPVIHENKHQLIISL